MGWTPRNLARSTMEPDVKPMASPSPLPLSRLATRVAYASTQLPRIAWYSGHFQIMRRLAQEVRRRNGEVTPSKPPADAKREAGLEQRLDADRRALFAQDIANVEAGIYPLPADHDGSLLTLLDRSRLFFDDLPDIDARREAQRDARSAERGDARQPPRLLPAEFPFPVGRLADRRLGGALRHPGRGAVQRHGERDAAAGAAAAGGSVCRARPAPLAADRRRLRHRPLPRLRQAELAAAAGARARSLGRVHQARAKHTCGAGRARISPSPMRKPSRRRTNSQRRGDQHLHDARAAAEGAPHRDSAKRRACSSPAAAWSSSIRSSAATSPTTTRCWSASRSSITSRITRAICGEDFAAIARQHAARPPARHQGLRFQGDGVRQAVRLTLRRACTRARDRPAPAPAGRAAPPAPRRRTRCGCRPSAPRRSGSRTPPPRWRAPDCRSTASSIRPC